MSGPEMRRQRDRLGLSRPALGGLLGVHWNTVNKWERGDNPIPEPVARLFRRIVDEHRATKAVKE